MLNEIRRKPEDGRRGGAWVLAQIPLLLLTFALPADPQGPGFKAELQEAPGSPARAQAVVGK